MSIAAPETACIGTGATLAGILASTFGHAPPPFNLEVAMMGPALLAAQSVSMRARIGGLEAHEVDDMRTRAEELLGRRDQLRAAIFEFHTMFQMYPRAGAELIELGEELGRAVDRALRADAPDAGRVDIHG